MRAIVLTVLCLACAGQSMDIESVDELQALATLLTSFKLSAPPVTYEKEGVKVKVKGSMNEKGALSLPVTFTKGDTEVEVPLSVSSDGTASAKAEKVKFPEVKYSLGSGVDLAIPLTMEALKLTLPLKFKRSGWDLEVPVKVPLDARLADLVARLKGLLPKKGRKSTKKARKSGKKFWR